MVLKGEMLMAANSIRRMTKDADLSAHGLANGVRTTCAKRSVMREGDEYHGVRCKQIATLGRARIPFALDVLATHPAPARAGFLRSHARTPQHRALAVAFHLSHSAPKSG